MQTQTPPCKCFPFVLLSYETRLQKVVAGAASAGRNCTLILRDGLEDGETWLHVPSRYVHDGCNITTAVAVVGCGPDSYYGLLGEVELLNVSSLQEKV